jgi:hypothetical protein
MEIQTQHDIHRIANALERLVSIAEHHVYGVTGAELAQVKKVLADMEQEEMGAS